MASERGLSLLTDYGWAAADISVHTHKLAHAASHAEQKEHKDFADDGQTAVQWLRLSLIKLFCSFSLVD